MEYRRENGTKLFRFAAAFMAMVGAALLWEAYGTGLVGFYISGAICVVLVWVFLQSRSQSHVDTQERILVREGRFFRWSWKKVESLDSFREIAVTFTMQDRQLGSKSPKVFHVVLMHKLSRPIEKAGYMGRGTYIVESFMRSHEDAINFAQTLSEQTQLPVVIDTALQNLMEGPKWTNLFKSRAR